MQAFTKTFPFIIYQDFKNPLITLSLIFLPLILCIFCYPFAQTQVPLPAFYTGSTTDCLIHLHHPPPKVSSHSEATSKHAGRLTKIPKRQEVLFWKEPDGVNYTLKFLRGLEAAVPLLALSVTPLYNKSSAH